MAAYFQVKGTDPGPAFRFKDGKPLIHRKFVDYLKRGLIAAGIDHKKNITATVSESVLLQPRQQKDLKIQ